MAEPDTEVAREIACAAGTGPEALSLSRIEDQRVKVLALGSLFTGGALLALLWLALVDPAGVDDTGLLTTVLGGLIAGGLLLTVPLRLPQWVLHAAGVYGTVLITAAIAFTGDGRSVGAVLYIWVAVFTGFFSTVRAAAAHLSVVAAAYGLLLLVEGGGERGFGWWLFVVGTAAITCALVMSLRREVRELVERLANASRIDLLTGMQNRRGFHEHLEGEIERATRGNRMVSVVTGDIDHFSEVADRLGGEAADAAIVRAASALHRTKRKIDSAARIGGQEFAFVLPDTDEHGAYIVAERMRAGVARHTARLQLPLTISFGVACHPQHGWTPEELLAASCQAVAAAKTLGRDRTVIHSPEVAAILAERRSVADRESEVALATILILAEAVDIRDTGTARHCHSVARFASAMAEEMGLPPAAVERLRLAGMLHDVGKIGVPDAILRKPGRLTPEEWEEMKRHPEIGARILSTTAFEDIRGWILAHHERVDGKGYPKGLPPEEIPMEARILAVADAFEAMTADRPYRASIGAEAARKELRRHAGTQFDSEVVDAFLRWLERRPAEEAVGPAPEVGPSFSPAPRAEELRGG
jgi:diguanylate cyclase (GGDEF)-like protein/putative nucleotidyltransferase with HDIG domain